MPTITYGSDPISVTSWRSKKSRTVYHYKVLIDGEHRATFQNGAVWSHQGFALKDATGGDINLPKTRFNGFYGIAKTDFDEVIKIALERNAIPTLAELDQWRLIVQAEKDNRAWDSEETRYRNEVHNEMLREALQRYVDTECPRYGATPNKRLSDKIKAAQKLLDQTK